MSNFFGWKKPPPTLPPTTTVSHTTVVTPAQHALQQQRASVYNQMVNQFAQQYGQAGLGSGHATTNVSTVGYPSGLSGTYTVNTQQMMFPSEEQAQAAVHTIEAYMAQTPEAKIKTKVKEALDDLGAYYCMPMSGGFGNSGVPDIVACIEGHFFGIECKANGKKPTALQEKHLGEIRSSKGATLVVDETNVDQVKHHIIALIGDLNGHKDQ